MKIIRNYNDFITALLDAGFAMGGGNSEGIYSVIPWGWKEEPPYNTPVQWHTGNLETDPWEWRMRVLDERNDIGYGKFFFRKSGYITREWIPYFLAVRRNSLTFLEEYESGVISHHAKRIYNAIAEYNSLPLHAIKKLAGFGKDEKSLFDRGLTELQMKMYLTMCGRQYKLSQKGEEYGWSSTVFCLTENFWGNEVFEEADSITKEEGIEKIRQHILTLNPNAQEKKILKFIKG